MLLPKTQTLNIYGPGLPEPASADSDPFNRLRAYFGRVGQLSGAELDLLRDIASDARYHPPNKNLWAVGTPPPPPRLLVSGWACRYQVLSGGERQIMCLLLPGDFVSPPLEPHLPSQCGVIAITEVETISAKALADAVAMPLVYPMLAQATLLAVHLQDMFLCQQIIRLSQQSANQRFIHLMLELRIRLSLFGLAQGNSFALPLTQDIIANTLGLSAVHLNRTLQQLRKEGLLKLTGGIMTLLRLEELEALVK